MQLKAQAGDRTSAPRWLDETETQAWRGLVQVLQLLPLALDRQLQEDAGLPHAYYLILAMLSEAPDRSMRMTTLAERTATSLSRLSHSVSRLEERGWVQRRPCPQDRRGQLAVLTPRGFRVLADAAPGHVAEVRRRVLDPLTRRQVRALADVARTLAAGLSADVVPTTRTRSTSCPSSA